MSTSKKSSGSGGNILTRPKYDGALKDGTPTYRGYAVLDANELAERGIVLEDTLVVSPRPTRPRAAAKPTSKGD